MMKTVTLNDIDVSKLKFENVVKTYNGKVGCACGCQGKYNLPCADLIERGNQYTGYSAYDLESVSERACKRRFTSVLKYIEFFKNVENLGSDVNIGGEVNDDGEYELIWADVNGRATTIYFNSYWERLEQVNDSRFEGKEWQDWHGSPYDRESADSYYWSPADPHYWPNGERVEEEDMTPEEIEAYHTGFNYNEQFGDKKDWG